MSRSRARPHCLFALSQSRSSGRSGAEAGKAGARPTPEDRTHDRRTNMPASKPNALISIIDRKLDVSGFREQHWEGTFWEYLDLAAENPTVSRNAFQRVYDMILSYGSEVFTQFKQEYTRYKFFADPIDHGADAIYGLEK